MTASDQSYQHIHTVLTAGRLSGPSHGAGSAIERLNIGFIHAETADTALQAIKASAKPFSLIICDDDIQGVDGIGLLSRIRSASVNTLGFLISENFTRNMLIRAVNQAGVRRCIQAPFVEAELMECIQEGLAQFEQKAVQTRTFMLGRKQNGKLYELNCELIETTKSGEKELARLEQEVKKLKAQLKTKNLKRPLPPRQLADHIREYLESSPKDPGPTLALLYEQVLTTLHTDLTDFSLGNGIEMPESLHLMDKESVQPSPSQPLLQSPDEADKAGENE